ncbi:MAG: tRNA (cytidine(34)-2'-O)-methyltransferase, partial [Planctomycetota bacterium]
REPLRRGSSNGRPPFCWQSSPSGVPGRRRKRRVNSGLRRAGLDYWQHLHWEIVDHWEHLQSVLQPNRWWYFSKKATASFREIQYQPGDALVFGCETSGLPESITSAHPERLLRIPTTEHGRSLNLSCAGAVAGFEATRLWPGS